LRRDRLGRRGSTRRDPAFCVGRCATADLARAPALSRARDRQSGADVVT